MSDNPFLFLTLPCVCASREALVITLTEEEQETLRQIYWERDTTVSLRETDILGLTIDDIDWENATIHVLQDKTDYEIVLPMSMPVANALFRYIVKERPAADRCNLWIHRMCG